MFFLFSLISRVFIRSPLLNMPSQLHPELENMLSSINDMTLSNEHNVMYLNNDQLDTLKHIPNISGASVIRYIRDSEDSLVTSTHELLGEEIGSYNTNTRGFIDVEMRMFLRWISVLLLLAESIGSDDGSELINIPSITTYCRVELQKVIIDRSILLEAIEVLGNVVHQSITRVGGVGGAWAEINGQRIFGKLRLTMRQALYA